ncbi:Hsp20/alpha crystallin family protein [Halorarum halophilum]|uniref:Hsp20/alpha crystallin family protein n=1 Tax=Halorarum halophilum TaxID=2743090 RepID=A0A7D5KJW5_9EURY|nr:Hsp20/alpha crystallin family protein [Halobaculum halophilum]QLG26195.1 Hsp20/alpha crystallin family protein [Halobaculum halophilum]
MKGRSERRGDLKEVGKSAVTTVLDRVGRGMGKVQERTPLPYDLLESEDAYLVVFDAPGTTRSDIQVRFREGAVEVRVDRFRDFHEGFEMRFPGRGLSLDGRAQLPPHASVDPAGAEATLTDNGTLRVTLPKTEEERSTTLTIEGDEEADRDADTEDDDWKRPPGEDVGMGEPEDEAETLEEGGEYDESDEYDSPEEYEQSRDDGE